MLGRRLALACALLAFALPASARADDDPPSPTDLDAPRLPAPGSPSTPAAAANTRVRYTLEGIELRGNTRTAGRVLLHYVRFRAGDILDVNDPEIELTRYRLLGTGFFATVQMSLRKGSKRGTAYLVIEVTERNTLVVQNLWLGIAADEDTAGQSKPLSAFVGLQAAETNLLGTGVTLGAGIGLAANQVAFRTFFEAPRFVGTGWSAALSLLYNDAQDFFGNRSVSFESPLLEQREVTDYAVVAYKRLGATLGTGHDLTLSSRFLFDYHLERVTATVPTVASHQRGNTREPIDFNILPGHSVLSRVHATILHDTRDTPFLTTRGGFASASITVGMAPLGSDYGFAKIELAAQRWWQLPWKHVVRASAYAGGIAGSAPFFQKFYVGDFTDLLPDRILELAPDRRQPPNLLNTDIVEVRYGDFAARIDGEYRVPLYTGQKSVYAIDLFATVGIYAVAAARDFTDPPSGYQGLRRLPVDLTYNLGLRVDTSVGGATIAFSNLLGLFPARRGDSP